jgi:hypothetical protein
MPRRVDCSESVEEALARLDLESKQKKLLALEKAKGVNVVPTSSSSTTTPTGEAHHHQGQLRGGELDGNKLVEALRSEDNSKSRKLYPERGGDKYKPSWFKILFRGEGREGLDKLKCERNVWTVIRKSEFLSEGLCFWKFRKRCALLFMTVCRSLGAAHDGRLESIWMVCDRLVLHVYRRLVDL